MTIQRVTEHDFERELSSQGLTLVDFDAPWCPPCKVLSPILEQLHMEKADKINILKVNCDDSPALAAKYSVMSMPTVILFQDGVPVEKLVGLRPKEVYSHMISKYEQVKS